MSRALVRRLLETEGYLVEAYAGAVQASRAVPKFRPMAVVADIDLRNGPSGIDLVVALKKREPRLRVVILSNYAIAPDLRHAALADAAYLNKRDLVAPEVLLATLKSLFTAGLPESMNAREAAGGLAGLTHAQTEVLRLVAAGLTNEEIASRRGTTAKSVENMIHRIMATLGISSDHSTNGRVAAARLFMQEAGPAELPQMRGDETHAKTRRGERDA